MKAIKTITLALGMLAFATAVNAQQQTTQKTQTSTPATGTNELKKTDAQKKADSKGTLTTAERNAAARRHRETRNNGASPSLTDSRAGGAATKDNAPANTDKTPKKVENAKEPDNGQRRSTGQRTNSGSTAP